MKANELREMNLTDLNNALVNSKKELFNLRFQLATGQLENQVKIRSVRRDIARINTIITEKQALS
ncbi:50S ribosomal protein L29 [Criibacterium bergeronii]|uniref:Large ribosomal subunit protein uL29 n=1 Tax=Criibacterium bergeronii TaxID=1871336 RepID=A0A371IMT4_9FIRM|nr:50S ribosomal protein L29 [Criibacterium bergeronii]MBS6063886.1 50S ribosomal protein L29 [Peptostreptococcaceae bacterium]RDY21760.1 50S ribosomal protein L29 [Criibacterium bergeronii]TRW26023.1 50S ribosomal protein L29 [Criibacterium bergeronii]